MSLRARLLATLLLLVAIGLVVADGATYSALRSFQYQRIDAQLLDARGPVFDALRNGGNPGFGIYAQYRDPNGGAHEFLYHAPGTDPDVAGEPAPVIPSTLPGAGVAGSEAFFNAHAVSGPLTYRVLSSGLPDQFGGGTLIVAVPLTDVTSTLHRLILLMLGVGLGCSSRWPAWRSGVCAPACGPWRRWVRRQEPSRPAISRGAWSPRMRRPRSADWVWR